ncbi:hypothetical protein [Methanolobus profundi]|uniref:Uncharacterized protein n=1 Tax=Methanolobus profundi TaxID=487685 RepID=A0A1I4QLN9_9EURY|nr:hypothetical protein [Methanolobus profundi]SFM40553.1 hypothetical protein SAMN04488696_1069 [Methanolobus profundi]
MSSVINFRLDITKEDLRTEQELSRDTDEFNIDNIEPITSLPGEPLEEARFVEPITALVGATVLYLAKRMIDHWFKEKEQGVMMDLREVPPLISRIAGIPTGFLVIIDKDGQATTHKVEYDKGDDEALRSMMSVLNLALNQ